ncbi:unnamed protein product [Cuscuta epithymum]|uniref:Uncharacterized protein n=1 Tax=Cuscuta epithymum TaxID=186058 RepID=A0AAV0G953_9ASTE|nr:unnamed protein product [Cuscuta epithymum]
MQASLAFGELVRRAEQHRLEKAKSDEVTRKLVANNTEAIRQLASLEEALRQSEKRLETARQEARAEGKAEAEKAAAEAAKKAAEDAEAQKAVAISNAKEEAVAAFIADGWKAEEYQQWVASVVEASADDWVKGPGAMWLALKGKCFYEGGQYFTQAMLYRKLARHFGVDDNRFRGVVVKRSLTFRFFPEYRVSRGMAEELLDFKSSHRLSQIIGSFPN